MLRTAYTGILLLAFSATSASPAQAARCASPSDVAALKTAVIQQELMVAAFQCRETSAYNQFVIAYQRELQTSDAALKGFFVRRDGRRGEAGYDSFKTKAANLSALEQARHSADFCADAHALFAAAFAHRGSLTSFVESRPAATDIGNICVESHPSPVLARTARVSDPVQAARKGIPDAAVASYTNDEEGPPSPSYSRYPRVPYDR